MSNGKNKFDRVVNLPEEYEIEPEIAKRAIRAIEKEEKSVTGRKRSVGLFIALSGVSAALLFASIFIPLYILKNKPKEPPAIIYYADEQIEANEVLNLEEIVSDNNLNIKFFSDENTQSQLATVTETGELAYIEQSTVYIDETCFDIVNLKIVLKQNTEFAFFRYFEDFTNSVMVDGVISGYNVIAGEFTDKRTLRIKFSYENVGYYYEIQTQDASGKRVETYVKLLLEK